jgi:hypothetical protein
VVLVSTLWEWLTKEGALGSQPVAPCEGEALWWWGGETCTVSAIMAPSARPCNELAKWKFYSHGAGGKNGYCTR